MQTRFTNDGNQVIAVNAVNTNAGKFWLPASPVLVGSGATEREAAFRMVTSPISADQADCEAKAIAWARRNGVI